MAAAFDWGILAASSLVIGALVALRFRISLRAIGLIMGFGAGVLISAVAFDLVEEATAKASGHGAAVVGIFVGCGVFFFGDLLIDHFGEVAVRMQPAAKRAVPRSPSCSEACSTGSRVGGDRPDDLPRRGGRHRLPGCGLYLQPARIDLLDGWPCHRRLEEGAHPVDVDSDRTDLGTRLACRLESVRQGG
jgi:hypothetical protein